MYAGGLADSSIAGFCGEKAPTSVTVRSGEFLLHPRYSGLGYRMSHHNTPAVRGLGVHVVTTLYTRLRQSRSNEEKKNRTAFRRQYFLSVRCTAHDVGTLGRMTFLTLPPTRISFHMLLRLS